MMVRLAGNHRATPPCSFMLSYSAMTVLQLELLYLYLRKLVDLS